MSKKYRILSIHELLEKFPNYRFDGVGRLKFDGETAWIAPEMFRHLGKEVKTLPVEWGWSKSWYEEIEQELKEFWLWDLLEHDEDCWFRSIWFLDEEGRQTNGSYFWPKEFWNRMKKRKDHSSKLILDQDGNIVEEV